VTYIRWPPRAIQAHARELRSAGSGLASNERASRSFKAKRAWSVRLASLGQGRTTCKITKQALSRPGPAWLALAKVPNTPYETSLARSRRAAPAVHHYRAVTSLSLSLSLSSPAVLVLRLVYFTLKTKIFSRFSVT